MKKEGTYEEKYYISGTTDYTYEGYKITYNKQYYITCNGYLMGKLSGRKVKLYDYPVKSLHEAKAFMDKLSKKKKKFNFGLAVSK